MKITPTAESVVSPVPFRSVAWGAQCTRGKLEALALQVGFHLGSAPRLPRGGIGASDVSPHFTLAMREKGALQYLKNAGRNPKLPQELREEIKVEIAQAEKALESTGQKKPKKSLDF